MNRRRYVGALVGIGSLTGCLRLTGDEETETPSGDEPTEQPSDTPRDDQSDEGEQSDDTQTESATPIPVDGSWPEFHGDAANTGYGSDVVDTTAPVGVGGRREFGEMNTSSPVVADGAVFLGVSEGDTSGLRAYDIESGEERWRQSALQWVQAGSAVTVADGTVYASEQGASRVFALDAESGSIRWRYDTGEHLWSAPTVADETVFVGTTGGRLLALDVADGSLRWEYTPDARSILSTPAVVDGTVYVTTSTPEELPEGDTDLFDTYWYGDFFNGAGRDDEMSLSELAARGGVHAVSAADGAVEWTQTVPHFVSSSPAVADGTVCFGCFDGSIYAVEAGSGDQRWSVQTENVVAATPAVAEGTVYAGSSDGTLYAVSLADGSQEWVYPVDAPVTGSPAVTDSAVYVASDGRGVLAVDLEGREQWRFEGYNGDFNTCSPAVVDGAVFVTGDFEDSEEGPKLENGALFLLTGV